MNLKIKFKVLGKSWHVKLLTQEQFDKDKNGDACAVTYVNERKIHLAPSGFDEETIIHELVHAYLGEMCLNSTSKIKTEDFEEIFCELLSKRGREILKLGRSLRNKVKKRVS